MADEIVAAGNPLTSVAELVIDNLSGNSKAAEQSPVFDSEALIQKSQDSVTMSITAKQMGELYDKLGAIGDEESKVQAKEAFRGAIVDQIDSEQGGMNFVASMKELSENDAATFQETFKTAYALDQGDYDSKGFLDTVVRLKETNLQRSFVGETNNIINDQEADDDTKHATFSKFMTTVNSAISSAAETEDYSGTMASFFGEIGQQQGLEAKNDFMDRYQEKKAEQENTDSED